MAEGLEQAAGERWTASDELLRTAVLRLDLIWRQLVVNAGGDPPEPLEVLRPGEKKVKPSGLRSLAQRAMKGR